LEKYKKRASIEGKNAELKRFHGLYRARGYGMSLPMPLPMSFKQ